jgi:hypothetical protein
VKRAAAWLICLGLVGLLVFGLMAWWAVMLSFAWMDNPPRDPICVPMWNIGRIGLAVGLAMTAIGAVLAVVAWLRDIAARRSAGSTS